MPGRGRRVGLVAWSAWALAAMALGACGETTGLVLDEAPSEPAFDAGLRDDAAVVDAGCASCAIPVVLTGQSPTTERGQQNETAYDDTCPGDQAVIGYQGTLTSASVGLTLVGSLSALCGSLALQESFSESVTVSAGATLPVRGTAQVDPWTQSCPADQVVVGFSGRSGADIDQLALVCAPLLVSPDAGDALTLGPTTVLAAVGGDGGTAFNETSCPAGEVARGGLGYAGAWVDAFSLVCATPTLAP